MTKGKALRYLMFLKEKREGTIKARGCANRRGQCEYTTKADSSSPTVSLKAMMMLCPIDAREGRHVAVTDTSSLSTCGHGGGHAHVT